MAREERGVERMRMCCGGVGWGLFFLLIGVVWFAKDMGWIPEVPIFPLVLIVLGIGIIVNHGKSA